eukprot:Gb_04963 [translate_table: standard]
MEGLGQRRNIISVDKQALLFVNQDKIKASKILTLPTILTLGRVAAIPLLMAVFYLEDQWATTTTTSIFVAAAITDWLDGYIARKEWSKGTGSGLKSSLLGHNIA